VRAPGLLDALYCSSAASEAIPATVRSVLRVLRPGASMRVAAGRRLPCPTRLPPSRSPRLRAFGSDARPDLFAGGTYVSLHSGGVLGLAPPANLEEYMADARWASLETRRLLPKSDGLFLYIWTMQAKSATKTRTRNLGKARRGKAR
jgi:hypothetical protein